MRKVMCGAGLAAIIAIVAPGCHRKFKEPVSIIEMADREATNQLIAGFHQLEDNRWRWTARKFSVILKPPPNAEERGATLELQLYVPPGQVEKLGAMRLNADAGDIRSARRRSQVAGSFGIRAIFRRTSFARIFCR